MCLQSGCRQYTKIPLRLFNDYSPNGSLYTILATCFSFKEAQNLRRFELQNMQKKERNLQLIGLIEEALVVRAFFRFSSLVLRRYRRRKSHFLCCLLVQVAGHLKYPKVMLSSTVPSKNAPKLKAIIKNHKGTLVTSLDQATHIIVKDAPKDPSEDPGLDYLRTLEVKGKQALVHWWYYPDSYDEWLPASEVEGDAPSEEPHDGPWILVRSVKSISPN